MLQMHRRCLPLFVLCCQEGDPVGCDLGNEVYDPKDESKTYEIENACNKGDYILGLKETDDPVNTAYNSTEDKLKNDLEDLGECLVLSGYGFVCHSYSPFGCVMLIIARSENKINPLW